MEQIQQDPYSSPNYLAHHARIEQYQIYSLIIDDHVAKVVDTRAFSGKVYNVPDGFYWLWYETGAYSIGYVSSRQPTRETSLSTREIDGIKVVAVQTFCPYGKIPIDLTDWAKQWPVTKENTTLVTTSTGDTSYTTSAERANYQHLILGNHPSDPRTMPKSLRGVAQSTRLVRWKYYSRNGLESHPNVSYSLDWRNNSVYVVKGQRYKLPFDDAALGTLVIDDRTAGELQPEAGKFELSYLRIGADLNGLIELWNDSYPPAINPPPNPPFADGWVDRIDVGGISIAVGPPYRDAVASSNNTAGSVWTFLVQKTTHEPRPRILAANNDRWSHSSPSSDHDPPEPLHRALVCNDYRLYYIPQPDGSQGELTMEGPMIREVHAALNAGHYAIDPDDGGARVANLGWMIEKIGNILGLRRRPNGKFLPKAEQATFDRTRLNRPTWNAGAYDTNSWGNQGYAMKFLPTAYKNGQRQDNQYDMVHDLPQMLAAVLDQIDHGQGLQHTAEIRIQVGDKVQAYPNVGALTIDLMTRMIELEALMERTAVMSIETSNTVRELFPAIGIPTSTKAVTIDIGGKKQNIYYPAFQAGKGSILDRLMAIASNLGIMAGQMAPGGQRDNRMNPFAKGKKK
jgi:hypothetical protein